MVVLKTKTLRDLLYRWMILRALLRPSGGLHEAKNIYELALWLQEVRKIARHTVPDWILDTRLISEA